MPIRKELNKPRKRIELHIKRYGKTLNLWYLILCAVCNTDTMPLRHEVNKLNTFHITYIYMYVV